MLGIKKEQPLREGLNLPPRKNKQDGLDLIIKLYLELFAYPDTLSCWRKKAVELGDKLMAAECFDAIISTCGPPSCNLIAKDLKEKYNIPWIADFRDLWTQNHYYQYSSIRKYFEKKLELETISKADAIVAVSKPMSEYLNCFHKRNDAHVITNGFDPNQVNAGTPLPEKFTITYTGTLIRGKRDPGPLFKALSKLIRGGNIDSSKISIDFFGPKENWLQDDIRKFNLENVVKIHGSVSRDESIDRQRRSHLLLLLTWDNPDEKILYAAKIFDYMAARRPIIALGVNGGVVAELLHKTGIGYQVQGPGIETCILNSYEEFVSTKGLKYNGRQSEINKYNHIEMARKFSELLNIITNEKAI
jgi:glycosyltransferase involved in cell wall biosynthesis